MFHRSAFLAAAILAAGLAAPAQAGTVSASATVNVVKPIQLTKVSDLSFGTITFNVDSSGTATVTISQAGVVTCPTGAVCGFRSSARSEGLSPS